MLTEESLPFFLTMVQSPRHKQVLGSTENGPLTCSGLNREQMDVPLSFSDRTFFTLVLDEREAHHWPRISWICGPLLRVFTQGSVVSKDPCHCHCHCHCRAKQSCCNIQFAPPLSLMDHSLPFSKDEIVKNSLYRPSVRHKKGRGSWCH